MTTYSVEWTHGIALQILHDEFMLTDDEIRLEVGRCLNKAFIVRKPQPSEPREEPSLADELVDLLNRHSAENGSNTPDFILATYLRAVLTAFDDTVKRRDAWYGVTLAPGRS